MHYHHRFVVGAPLADVVAFHCRPVNMRRLTPPPILVQFQQRPDEIYEGAEMRFTLWMGPLPVRWRARFDNVTATGFRDCQLEGPFARWEHVHTFVPIDDQRTEVIDTLTVELTPYPFWRTVGRGMVLSFPLFFAWRQWQTRRALASVHPAQPAPA